MRLSQFKDPNQRRQYLSKKLKINLEAIKNSLLDSEEYIHCENLIGATSLPLGVAGPLRIKGEFVKADFYIPLATTEGALVASVNRGCKAVFDSGGVNVQTHRVGATRGPVFYTGSLKETGKFFHWIKKNENKLGQVAEKTSAHLKFKKLDIRTLSDLAFIRFYFDTQDAMGMNMVTIASQKIVDYIEKETKYKCLSVAGNFDIDKKASWLNFINNRGFKGWAEVVISKKIVAEGLKTTPQQIFEVWLSKCLLGSAMSGSLGFNSHFANIVAAFFAATGQDLAHVVEGSLGITTAKVLSNGDLYFSIYMPSLMLGTVGGGTKLKTKQEALKIIGVKKSVELAEVLLAAVLAGELSLLSSLAEGTLAKAHHKLGR